MPMIAQMQKNTLAEPFKKKTHSQNILYLVSLSDHIANMWSIQMYQLKLCPRTKCLMLNAYQWIIFAT